MYSTMKQQNIGMIEFHKTKKADVTIATIKVPSKDTSDYGIACIDNEQRVVDWQEKPKKAPNHS